MVEATGRGAFGREGALVVPSCPVHVLPDYRAVPGQKATKKKGTRAERGGSTTGCRPEESGERGGVYAHERVRVCSVTAHNVVPFLSPVLTHTGGQRDQTSLLASDIFICSEQSLPREGDPRDAPEQILTSSIRSL